MKRTILVFFLLIAAFTQAQQLGPLTVEKIMRDPQWIGTSPSNIFWSPDGQRIYFDWNPEKAKSDSLYFISLKNHLPQKADAATRAMATAQAGGAYNHAKNKLVYEKEGDIFLLDIPSGKITRITQTNTRESNPQFSFNDTRIVYLQSQNLFAWDPATGLTQQLTDFEKEMAPTPPPPPTAQEAWLQKDQLENSAVLKERHDLRLLQDSLNKIKAAKRPKTIYIENQLLDNIVISPDGQYITYRLTRLPANAKNTIVPNYLTETGFTEEIPSRTKVGVPGASYGFFVYIPSKDTVIPVKTDSLPGITDPPDYVKASPLKADTSHNPKPVPRAVVIHGPFWNEKGTHAFVVVRSLDNKDRWIMQLDAATGRLQLIDRQRDEAWVAGPGIGWNFSAGNVGWIDEYRCWFQSEASGYSHLYTYHLLHKEKKALTSGHYEVQHAWLSRDKKYFYLITNEVHPGEQQFYRLPLAGGKAARITTMTGANEVVISPDEKMLALRHSYSNKPWELYLQENSPGSVAQQITTQAQSDEFRSYPWRDPELIHFTARDGATVYARLYRPLHPPAAKPAVLFVHGAGYLQNAHKWWSSYFHEYLFHNLLADHGYTVLDIDYRGSAGYGRDWRTGIYRHMGGKDLNDQVDGAKYLVEKLGIDPGRIGIYGGSYGGFLTLMAMFTTPGVFAAGAALRAVTDWAHYNHPYTSNILNEPFTDSLAYQRSSPIYFAAGLKGQLLLCHGMVDTNVHFQDIVRLTQRLIELGKDNWELAVYPLEDHGFIAPSSWIDEYKRIFKLWEEVLKK